MTMQLHDKNLLVQLHNDPGIIGFVLKLTDADSAAFKQMLLWPRSLIGMLSKNDSNFIGVLNKCTDEDLAHVRDMLQWPSTVFALLSKNDKVLKFLNRISDTELISMSQFMNWSDVLMTRLRDEPHHLMAMHKMWDLVPDMPGFLKTYFAVYDHPDFNNKEMMDAFSKGQLDSKVWLIDTVMQLDLQLGKTWTLCGWIGMLAYLMFLRKTELGISSVRSFDIDQRCESLAEILNIAQKIDNWQFKAFTRDVNTLDYNTFEWSVWSKVNNRMSYPFTDTVDTVINTSCDHMSNNDDWWSTIPADKLIILQNNDFFEHADHSNCCYSIDEFKMKYPMQTILFEGTLDCTLYNRFMLIGYK